MLARTRRTAAVAAAGAGLLAAVGCGAAGQPNLSYQSPPSELNHAIDALGDFSQVATDLHVEAGQADLQRIFPAMKADQAALLADAHVAFQIRAQGDKRLRDFQKGVNDLPDFQLTVSTSKGDAFDLREVEHAFYLKADDKLLTTLLGHPVNLGPAGKDQWVQANAPGLNQGLPVGKASEKPEPLAAPIPFLPTLRQWLIRHVKVDRVTADDPSGDKLKLTVDARDLVHQLVSEASQSLPSVHLSDLLRAFDDAPDRSLTAYAIVSKNRLSQVYAWLDQFEPGQHAPTNQLPGRDPRLTLGVDTSVRSIDKPAPVAATMSWDQLARLLQEALTSSGASAVTAPTAVPSTSTSATPSAGAASSTSATPTVTPTSSPSVTASTRP